jgi:hypothetical protein
LEQLKAGAKEAARLGLEVHAGHGLTFETVGPVAAIPEIVELSTGRLGTPPPPVGPVGLPPHPGRITPSAASDAA